MTQQELEFYKVKLREYEIENSTLIEQLSLFEEKFALQDKDSQLQIELSRDKVNTLELINQELSSNIQFYEQQTAKLNSIINTQNIQLQSLKQQLNSTRNNFSALAAESNLAKNEDIYQNPNYRDYIPANKSRDIEVNMDGSIDHQEMVKFLHQKLSEDKRLHVQNLEYKQEQIEKLRDKLDKKSGKIMHLQQIAATFSGFFESLKAELAKMMENSQNFQENHQNNSQNQIMSQLQNISKQITQQQFKQSIYEQDDTYSQISTNNNIHGGSVQNNQNQQKQNGYSSIFMQNEELKNKQGEYEQIMLEQLEIIKELELSFGQLGNYIDFFFKNDLKSLEFYNFSDKEVVQSLKNKINKLIQTNYLCRCQGQNIEKLELRQKHYLNLLQIKDQYTEVLKYSMKNYKNIVNLVNVDKEDHSYLLQISTNPKIKKLKIAVYCLQFVFRVKKSQKQVNMFRFQQKLFSFENMDLQYMFLRRSIQQNGQTEKEKENDTFYNKYEQILKENEDLKGKNQEIALQLNQLQQLQQLNKDSQFQQQFNNDSLLLQSQQQFRQSIFESQNLLASAEFKSISAQERSQRNLEQPTMLRNIRRSESIVHNNNNQDKIDEKSEIMIINNDSFSIQQLQQQLLQNQKENEEQNQNQAQMEALQEVCSKEVLEENEENQKEIDQEIQKEQQQEQQQKQEFDEVEQEEIQGVNND